MSFPLQINHLVILQIATAAFSIIVALSLFLRKEVSGARIVALLMLSLGIWTLTSGLEVASQTRAAKICFSKLTYLGIQTAPPLFFWFALRYHDKKEWLKSGYQFLLWIIPIITLLLVATNEYHRLVWSEITPSPLPGSKDLIYSHGIWFWISSFYHYLLVLGASILLILGSKEKKHKRNFWQIFLIMSGLAIAWIANIAYILGLSPVPGIDITPIALTFTVSLVALAIFPLRFLDITPIARSKLVDTMSDAFFVVDGELRLMDINPAALALVGNQTSKLVGKQISEVFVHWSELVKHIESAQQAAGEFYILQDSNTRWFDVRITPLQKNLDENQGWLIILRDISQSKIAETELVKLASGLRIVSEISLGIATSQQTERLLQDVVEQTLERFQFYYVQIFLFDRSGQKLTLAAGAGEIGRKLLETGFSIPIQADQSIIAWVAKNRQTMIVNNVSGDEKYLSNPYLPYTQSEMAVPLQFRDELLGVLDIQSDKIDHFVEMDQHIQNTLAAQISVALVNARLVNDLQKRAMEADTLRQASSAVAATLHQDEAVERVLEHLKKVVPYDSSSVQLLRGDYLEIVGGHGFSDLSRILGLRFSSSGDSASASVIQSKSHLILYDAQEIYADFRVPPHDHIHGWMGVPLMVQNQVIGVITLDSVKAGAFNQTHARLAQAFADHVAIALDNARLFEDTRRLAMIDPLTSINNRRHFYELAYVEFERSCRYHHPLAAIMLDLDHFKQINDQYGHTTGDQVLQMVAKTCQQRLRKSDIFGRYGGEEFVALMPETDEHRAWNVAERLRRSIARTPVHINGNTISITISLGVATLSELDLLENQPDDALEKLIDHADQALLQAKQAGRNRVMVYQAPENEL